MPWRFRRSASDILRIGCQAKAPRNGSKGRLTSPATCPNAAQNKQKGLRGLFVFTSKPLFSLVSRQGFEPWTYWLKVNCSTSWATDSYEAHGHEFREASRRGQSKKIKTFQFRRLNYTRNFYWRRNYGWNSHEKLEKYGHFHAYGYVFSLIQ